MISTEYFCKAKRTDNDEWVTGFYLFDSRPNGGSFIVCYDKYDEHTFTVDPSTLCRCIGIEDNNGRLIWENDIVKHDFGKDQIGVQFAIVKYDSKYACYQIKPIYDWMYCDKSDCEVVGNVFDNPELLEEAGIKKEPEEMEL